jgi:hypothetical protein
MDEQRTTPRRRVLKAGTIEFGAGAANCMVRNMSNIDRTLYGSFVPLQLTLSPMRVFAIQIEHARIAA